jgi:hypothetical protein
MLHLWLHELCEQLVNPFAACSVVVISQRCPCIAPSAWVVVVLAESDKLVEAFSVEAIQG